jgi:hypothetical protein
MKLVIPIWYGNTVYTDCEICTPSGEVLADAKKLHDENKIFTAMLRFTHGCIISVSTNDDVIETDKGRLKDIIRSIPMIALDHLVIQIVLQYDSNDGVEGIYHCPRCGEQKICENADGIDTRDFISDLDVYYWKDEINKILVKYDKPFEIVDKKGQLVEGTEPVSSLTFRHITLSDWIEAYSRYGMTDRVRLQYAVYVKALLEINGKELDPKWLKTWGMYIFEKNRNIKDTNKIGRKMNSYGMQTKVEKVCLKCGKKWQTQLNTSNFFVSALQSELL